MLDKLMAMHKTYLAENEALLSRYAWLGLKNDSPLMYTGYKKNKNRLFDDSML